MTELETEFEKLGNEKPQQSRFLRSQQDLKAKMEAKMAEGDGGDEGKLFNSPPKLTEFSYSIYSSLVLQKK